MSQLGWRISAPSASIYQRAAGNSTNFNCKDWHYSFIISISCHWSLPSTIWFITITYWHVVIILTILTGCLPETICSAFIWRNYNTASSSPETALSDPRLIFSCRQMICEPHCHNKHIWVSCDLDLLLGTAYLGGRFYDWLALTFLDPTFYRQQASFFVQIRTASYDWLKFQFIWID